MERRLAAILATDVVGYSRLIRADEEGTIAALKALRADLVDPKLDEHNGRIVKLMGDGMLAEFPSVVDAVRAAVETQTAVAEHNANLPENKRIEFRVGINLGDVVIDGDDIHGDGVNIAARLEGIAEPGGICISGGVYEQVRDRTDFAFEDLGEQKVKNIDRPVQVWQWISSPDLVVSVSTDMDEPLPLPDKPSIAVLPFLNMSGDPEQEYFADGICEDIITSLARFRGLAVTARNTSFTYKGAAADLTAVGRELNVRYILEGSVRKAGSRVRITAQLIDAQSGNHLWAERYDRELDDIFDVQDELTETLATTLEPEITLAEIERAKRRRAENITAWDYYLRSLPHFHQLTKEGNDSAIEFLEKSIALDDKFVPALSLLSICNTFNATFRWTEERRVSTQIAGQLARDAGSIDSLDSAANLALCWHYMFSEQMENALSAIQIAVDQEPNSSVAQMQLAGCLSFLCRPDEALEVLKSNDSMSRRDPWRWLWYMHLGNANFAAQKYDEVIRVLDQGAKLRPSWRGFYTIKAAAAGLLGRGDEAKDAIKKLLALIPRMSLRGVRRYPLFTSPETIENLLLGLQKAGLPE